jgi:Cu/Ag efflux pump CusA
MIEKLIELSIRNRFLVLLIAAALTVAGIYAMLKTPVDAFPDLTDGCRQALPIPSWVSTKAKSKATSRRKS